MGKERAGDATSQLTSTSTTCHALQVNQGQTCFVAGSSLRNQVSYYREDWYKGNVCKDECCNGHMRPLTAEHHQPQFSWLAGTPDRPRLIKLAKFRLLIAQGAHVVANPVVTQFSYGWHPRCAAAATSWLLHLELRSAAAAAERRLCALVATGQERGCTSK